MLEATYSQKQAFELYKYYLAIKNHFTGKMDYFKYNGHVNVKQTTFDTRKDRFQFYKLTNKSEPKSRIFANILHEPKTYIRDIVGKPECEEIFKDYLKRNQALRYKFQTDLGELDDITDSLTVKGNSHPKALRLFMTDNICIETLIILDMLTNCFGYWSDEIEDPVIWPGINTKCQRYKPFLAINKKPFKEILKEHL